MKRLSWERGVSRGAASVTELTSWFALWASMRGVWRCLFQKKRSSHCVLLSSCRERAAYRLKEGLGGVAKDLLLEALGEVVAAVGKVEGRGEEVGLEEAQEVRLVGVREEGDGGGAVEGEHGEVLGGVDGRAEDVGDERARGHDDEVVGW